MKSQLLFFTIFFIFDISSNVQVIYLKGVPRFGNTSYWDYYFSCNTEGQTLQWEVNRSPLGGFLSGQVGGVLFSSRSNFDYIATLLSSKKTTGGPYIFDSVLVVSSVGPLDLSVTCRNGSFFDNTDNRQNKMDVLRNDTTDIICLQYLFKKLSEDNISTSIFLCGVNSRLLAWQSDAIYAFTADDEIGRERRLQLDDMTVKQQAILLAHEPYQFVSILFVVDASNRNITCGDTVNELQFPIMVTLEDTNIDNTNSETNLSISSPDIDSIVTDRTLLNTTTATAISIGVVLALALILVVFVVIIFLTRRLRKRKKEMELPREKSDSKSIKIPRRSDIDCSEFCKRVQFIILTSNDIEFNAAKTCITGPDIEEHHNVILQINMDMYIGNIGYHPVGIIQDKTLVNCIQVLENAITEHFSNAEYILNVGGILASKPSTAKLADVLISGSIVHTEGPDENFSLSQTDIKPEIKEIFCSNPKKVKPLKISCNGQQARHLVVPIASDIHLLEIPAFVTRANVFEPCGFEKAGGELLKLQERKSKSERPVQVICINGVTGYMDDPRVYKDWRFIAHQAAFHYVKSKLKHQPVESGVGLQTTWI